MVLKITIHQTLKARQVRLADFSHIAGIARIAHALLKTILT